MTRSASRATVCLMCLVAPAWALVIDHDDVDAVATLPQATMDAIGQQRWFFSHASVGGNMMNGLADLNGIDPLRYQLTRTGVTYLSGEMRAADPPTTTTPGTVYDCSRGNPGWQNKLTIFDNSVRVSGWHTDKIDAAMDKFCYIDQAALPSQYLSTMSNLEAAYPNTVFVYVTMPLKTGEDSTNVQRNDYNDAVRDYCVTNGKLLYDIADIEAHDPNGVEQTFEYSGQTYQKLYSGYTYDGGHLNPPGRQRVALGWYATAAAIVQMQQGCELSVSIVNEIWGTVTLDPEPNDPNIPVYPRDTPVTLTAQPIEGRAFRHWEIKDPNHPDDANHTVIDANATITLVMDADREVMAVFMCGSSVGLAVPLALGMLATIALLRRR